METEIITENGITVAVMNNTEKIASPQDALDLAVTVKYETGAERIALPKKLLPEEFFILSSGLAGEILQKYINYGIKMAVWGTSPAIPASRSTILYTSQITGKTSSSWARRRRLCPGWPGLCKPRRERKT